MACETNKYVGKVVTVEYVISCGDVLPAENEWKPLGAVRGKEDSSEYDTVDTTADDSTGSVRENLATFRSDTLSFDGVSLRRDGTQGNQTALYKHFKNPVLTGGQPIVMFRVTYPDITLIDTYLLSSFSRSNPYDEASTYSLEASSTGSVVGQLILDTPDPDAADATAVVVAPDAVALTVGGSTVLAAAVAPGDVSQSVIWSTSDAAVATVNQAGRVTAVGAGTAEITATSYATDTVSGSATVTVTAP